MYADRITDSMRRAIDETRRRRDIQMAYNEEHGIKPQTIRKAINDIMGFITEDVEGTTAEQVNKELAELSREEVLRLISSMEDDMAAASRDMDFEEAARLRDQVGKQKSTVEDKSEEDVLKDLKKGARKGSAYGNRKHAAYGSSRANSGPRPGRLAAIAGAFRRGAPRRVDETRSIFVELLRIANFTEM